MRRIQAAAVLPIALAIGLAAEGEARAGHVCPAVEPGVIEADAMLDDWRGFEPLRRGQTSPDASFELRCAFDAQRLYLAVRVRDEHVATNTKTG